MYTKGEAKDAVKAFLDFIMSAEYGKSMESPRLWCNLQNAS